MKNTAVLLFIMFVLTYCIKAQETVTDIDGNIYQTVTIGSQVWMKENLKTTHYQNGEDIPLVTGGAEWYYLNTGAYCNYNNDNSKVAIYGHLYNWYAAVDNRKICPGNWHVPGIDEWIELMNYLGGTEVAGGKMKDTVYWNSPNTGGTNSSGFSGLPGGACDSLFINIGNRADFWSSTENTGIKNWAESVDLHYDRAKLFYGGGGMKFMGMSIRCIKDTIGSTSYVSYLNNNPKIYPNPAQNILQIEYPHFTHKKVSYEIIDLNGKTLQQEKLLNGNEIDVSKLSKGNYLLSLNIEGKTFSKKFIIK